MTNSTMAVASVGSTSFSSLIEAVLSFASLQALASHGISSLLVQHGTASPPPRPWLLPLETSGQHSFTGIPTLTVTLKPFVAEIDELLGDARIAITHAGSFLTFYLSSKRGAVVGGLTPMTSSAGAGSILAALRPSTGTQETQEVRRLIVVPNETLMDSHQSDLAEQIVRIGSGVSCEPRWARTHFSTVARTLAGQGVISRVCFRIYGLDVFLALSRLAETITKLDLAKETDEAQAARTLMRGGPGKFRALLDREMGFTARLDEQ